MREIKFRGMADKQGGGIEFVYGSLIVNQNQGCLYVDTHPDRICWMEGTAYCNKPIRKDTAMQYTGLKDKNGTEIYEGDIVEYQYKDGYSKKRVTVEYQSKRQYTGFNIGNSANYEVVGNIYENPDLLNRKEQ